jgi:ribosome modulation factor
MAKKTEKQLAYEAGRAMASEPPVRRNPGACPFEADTDERAEWLRGFSDAIEEQPSVADLQKQIKELS